MDCLVEANQDGEVFPKRWLLPTGPHGYLTQKNIIRNVIAQQLIIRALE
jgi:hypothetical protein